MLQRLVGYGHTHYSVNCRTKRLIHNALLKLTQMNVLAGAVLWWSMMALLRRRMNIVAVSKSSATVVWMVSLSPMRPLCRSSVMLFLKLAVRCQRDCDKWQHKLNSKDAFLQPGFNELTHAGAAVIHSLVRPSIE